MMSNSLPSHHVTREAPLPPGVFPGTAEAIAVQALGVSDEAGRRDATPVLLRLTARLGGVEAAIDGAARMLEDEVGAKCMTVTAVLPA